MTDAIPHRLLGPLLALVGLVLTSPAAAQAPVPQDPAAASRQAEPPWWKGQLITWASFGTTFAYGQTYGNANVGLGWLMRHGIAPNVEVGYTFGNSPTIWTLRPGVSWYLPVPVVRPYLGVYYSRWFVGSGRPDQNGIGARAGLSLGRALSVGVTYDRALGCSDNCDSWTPTLAAGYSF